MEILKKNTKLILLPFALLWAGACAGGEKAEPSGAMVYNLNCVRCHNARPAGEFSDREWDVIMPHMRNRAHLTGAESDAVVKFLQLSNHPETLKDSDDAGFEPGGPTAKEAGTKKKSSVATTKKKTEKKLSKAMLRKKRKQKAIRYGRYLARKYQCAGCHKINGRGGKIGPKLNGVASRKGTGFIRRKLRNPKFNNPSTAMPKFPLRNYQIYSIAEYLNTLK